MLRMPELDVAAQERDPHYASQAFQSCLFANPFVTNLMQLPSLHAVSAAGAQRQQERHVQDGLHGKLGFASHHAMPTPAGTKELVLNGATTVSTAGHNLQRPHSVHDLQRWHQHQQHQHHQQQHHQHLQYQQMQHSLPMSRNGAYTATPLASLGSMHQQQQAQQRLQQRYAGPVRPSAAAMPFPARHPMPVPMPGTGSVHAPSPGQADVRLREQGSGYGASPALHATAFASSDAAAAAAAAGHAMSIGAAPPHGMPNQFSAFAHAPRLNEWTNHASASGRHASPAAWQRQGSNAASSMHQPPSAQLALHARRVSADGSRTHCTQQSWGAQRGSRTPSAQSRDIAKTPDQLLHARGRKSTAGLSAGGDGSVSAPLPPMHMVGPHASTSRRVSETGSVDGFLRQQPPLPPGLPPDALHSMAHPPQSPTAAQSVHTLPPSPQQRGNLDQSFHAARSHTQRPGLRLHHSVPPSPPPPPTSLPQQQEPRRFFAQNRQQQDGTATLHGQHGAADALGSVPAQLQQQQQAHTPQLWPSAAQTIEVSAALRSAAVPQQANAQVHDLMHYPTFAVMCHVDMSEWCKLLERPNPWRSCAFRHCLVSRRCAACSMAFHCKRTCSCCRATLRTCGRPLKEPLASAPAHVHLLALRPPQSQDHIVNP